MNEYIGTFKKGDGLWISDDCLKNGESYGGISNLTLVSGSHLYIDIRINLIFSGEIEPQERALYKLARGSRFRLDESLMNRYEEDLANSVFMVKTFFFNLDSAPKPFVDIRAERLLYGDGNKVIIDHEYQVYWLDERVGQICWSKGNFWYLDDYDPSKHHLPDDIVGQLSDKKSITEIGEFLDDWFSKD